MLNPPSTEPRFMLMPPHTRDQIILHNERPLTSFIPHSVIIDVGREVGQFHEEISQYDYCNYELFLDETIQEIISFITDKFRIKDGIHALYHNAVTIYGREGRGEGIALGEAITHFAWNLYRLFHHHGLYSKEGLLPHEFAKWIDSKSILLVIRTTWKTDK